MDEQKEVVAQVLQTTFVISIFFLPLSYSVQLEQNDNNPFQVEIKMTSTMPITLKTRQKIQNFKCVQATESCSVHWLKTNALLEKTLELNVVMEASVI